jgi:putative transposase
MPSTPYGYRRRNSLRYTGYDYTQPGAYFVTFCTHGGRCIFGHVDDQGQMIHNSLGQIAHASWADFAENHPEIEIDIFIVMPNHIHVLLWILASANPADKPPPNKVRAFGDAIAGSLSTLIGAYKGGVTQKAKTQKLVAGPTLWHRNFHDHIVRGEEELQRIREYIRTNPQRWKEDKLHPDAPPNEFNREWR